MSDRRVAIVTGAGSGIGQAVSVLLAQAGWRLVLVGRTKATLAATSNLAGRYSAVRNTMELVVDVSEPGAANTIVNQTVSQWGRIDALINNAAVLAVQSIAHVDDATLTRVFAANLFGPARLIAGVWPQFISQRRGVVVNISSMATVDPFAGLGIYAASKAALESLTRSIVTEGNDLGIRAFSIAPGAVETGMLRSAFSADVLPTEQTLKPAAVACVVVQCVFGERDAEQGRVILVPSPQPAV